MADSTTDWQRQNFKKVGTEPAPSNMNPKLQGGSNQMHSKIAAPTHSMGGLVSSVPAVPHMANGGLVAGLAAGLGAAYLASRNKDDGGESKMMSGRDVERAQGKTGVENAPEPVKVEAKGENNPTDKGVTDEPQQSKMYKAEPSSTPAKTVEPVRAEAPNKTAARPVVSKPVNVSSGASGFGTAERELPSKPTPVKTVENDARPTKSYPDAVDRSIRAEAKSGAKTVYSDKPFSFQEKEKADREQRAKDDADRQAKARSRKTASNIDYDEMGNAR